MSPRRKKADHGAAGSERAPDLVQLGPAAAAPKQVEPSYEGMRDRAFLWAKENGLKDPLMVGLLERVDFPRFGHGYMVTVIELSGARRGATARFNSKGETSYWSIDTIPH